jgi:pteridine reductase
MHDLQNKTALITGASRRIGAAIARLLHAHGMNLVLHYRNSATETQRLCDQLRQQRSDSAVICRGDLCQIEQLATLVQCAQDSFGRLDLLVNNASSFYPSKVGEVDQRVWDDLMGSNLKGPFFLSQAAATLLKAHQGCIVNLVDIHAERPKFGYPVYSMAKAANAMMVKALARELAPDVRVNGIAPGAILWPEETVSLAEQQRILARTALQRAGNEDDIARTLLFLVRDAAYITGQIINVDGGRTLQQ